MNKILFLLICLYPFFVFAVCKEGDDLYRSNPKGAILAYQNCALLENDEDAQIRLANIYKTGGNIKKNEVKALLFYHLAADNGNAVAQTELAKLLLDMDKDEKRREDVVSYMKQIKISLGNDYDSSFKGEVLHPFVLLSLAAESSSQKWYYPTNTKYYPEATQLIKNYQLSDEKKRKLLSQGAKWKQRKMMETAREVLSLEEYKKFSQTLFPEQGKADPFLRQQAINELKNKVQMYLK